MTDPAPKPRRASGWSAERRARHAAAIQNWKPWERSTGPRTAAGKARSSQNARQDDLWSLLISAVRQQMDWHRRMEKNAKNELLNPGPQTGPLPVPLSLLLAFMVEDRHAPDP